MRFKSIDALLGWSYQMEGTFIIKGMTYGERQQPAFDSLTPEETFAQSAFVINKVNRLKKEEIACIKALHTWNMKSIHDAAYLLPNWPRPMQLALVRRWAGDKAMSQKQIAEMCGYSRKTVNERDIRTREILNAYYCQAIEELRPQLTDLLV